MQHTLEYESSSESAGNEEPREIPPTPDTLGAILDAGQDFEWYPTTDRMIAAVAERIRSIPESIMDIGAGDGRVLVELARLTSRDPRDGKGEDHSDRVTLYSIEKSTVLVQAQPDSIIPVGTDLFEQNLSCLPVDYIFCNPPYSQFQVWASAIIESGYAKSAYLVIPRRWRESDQIARSLKKRGATARVFHSDDFHDAERRARAMVDIVEISFPRSDGYYEKPTDPFDIWFDQNIDTFDKEEELSDDQQHTAELARIRDLNTIGEMVDAFNEEYARMQANYQAIFKLDHALLKELGVSKENVRDGIKKRMAGLKTKYWQLLFERLDTITRRLSTATKKSFLRKLTGRTSVAFTNSNAYAVVLWAIKNANKYFNEQLVQLFRDLSTFDGVMNYKSNQRTWGRDEWRFSKSTYDPKPRPTHYSLDYRIVVRRYGAIVDKDDHHSWDSPGGLGKDCHELIDDIIAVFGNLGFGLGVYWPSRNRQWYSNVWQDFNGCDESILFQVKAFKNGNVHLRIKPDAIRALNVEAGRLLGWIRNADDVIAELGYTPEEATRFFGSSHILAPSKMKLLAGKVA